MGSIAEDMRRLRGEVEQGRAQRRETLERVRDEVGALTGAVRDELDAARDGRAERAREMKRDLREQVGRIAEDVERVRGEARALVGDYARDRVEGAERDRVARHEALERLRDQVSGLRAESSERLARVRAELEEAHALWHGTWTAPEPPPAPEPVAVAPEPAPAPEPEPAPTPTPTPEPVASVRLTTRSTKEVARSLVPDDLERIVGIGPSTAEVLSSAGFTTFDALAGCSPDELNDVLGDLARFANVEHWIRQASEFARA